MQKQNIKILKNNHIQSINITENTFNKNITIKRPTHMKRIQNVHQISQLSLFPYKEIPPLPSLPTPLIIDPFTISITQASSSREIWNK